MMFKVDLGISKFLKSGFDLKDHLSKFLKISLSEIESKLPNGVKELAALHPGSLDPEKAEEFYEITVGDAHLIDLAAWHLGSADYIADTLRLQEMFAKGKVLDFGGGIGTHALAAASLSAVEHVYFVDLNPQNREFVRARAKFLGLENSISVYRDLESVGDTKFDTLICLDVLEHLPDPSKQICSFIKKLNNNSISLLNWYFYKGEKGEYPFHFDDPKLINEFFVTIQSKYIEVFHPYLITARAYKLMQ